MWFRLRFPSWPLSCDKKENLFYFVSWKYNIHSGLPRGCAGHEAKLPGGGGGAMMS